MSARQTLIDRLKAIVGEEAQVIGVEDNHDLLGQITVMVKQRRMMRLPETGKGSLRVEFIVSVTHPAVDPAVSEPELDDFVPSLLAELDLNSWFGWTDANKVQDGQTLGYDIDCYLLAGHAKPTPTASADNTDKEN